MSITTQQRYQLRKERVKSKIFGTELRPRLSVYRSLKHIYAQIIDDVSGKTLAQASTVDSALPEKSKNRGNIKAAELVGKLIAERAKAIKIKKVIYDRGGRVYHGVVKSIADSARENGLEF